MGILKWCDKETAFLVLISKRRLSIVLEARKQGSDKQGKKKEGEEGKRMDKIPSWCFEKHWKVARWILGLKWKSDTIHEVLENFQMTWHHRESEEMRVHGHVHSSGKELASEDAISLAPSNESSIKAFSPASPALLISGCLSFCALILSCSWPPSSALSKSQHSMEQGCDSGWGCIFDQDLCKFHSPTEWIFSFALKIRSPLSLFVFL